ncbi:Spy/CpxP family protein refolding chaperone [Halomonas sp.]|uniref:Spy/CpxP family protein refolding chaperone n=1 Tax=Halomonas sp. TaxID=1486246 RepID=UPI003D0F8738
MGKHKRTLAIALAAGLGLAASGAASAQGGMGPGMMGYGQGGMGPGMMGYGYHGMGPGMMGYGHHGMGPGMMGYGHHGMGPGMMGFGPGGMGPGMLQQLDPEQRNQMWELMEQHRAAQFARMGEMMELRQELMTALHAESPDPDEVQSLQARMGELQGEMLAEMVRMHGNMLDLLTDEQRERLRWGAGSADDAQ